METQKDIDKFLLGCGNEDPLMVDFLFHKLYNQLGESQEDNILRDILEYSFDFSNKKNNCVAMKVGEFSACGEPCEDVYCYKHILQIKTLGWLPRPCGVGSFKLSGKPVDFKTTLDFKTRHDTKPPRSSLVLQNWDSFQ